MIIKTRNQSFSSLNILITFFIIAVTFFINCGGNSSSKIVVSPDFKKHPLINAALGLVIQDEKPLVIYNGNVQRALGDGNTEELIRGFFQKQLLSDISKEVDIKETFALSAPANYLLTKKEVEFAEEDFTIVFPIEKTKIDFGSNRADLVLFLSNIRLGTETAEYYHSRVDHGINTTVGRHLIYISNFVLWDNRIGSYICYGRVKSRVPIRTAEESVITEWEEVSRQFVRTIFEPTGFLKRARNR